MDEAGVPGLDKVDSLAEYLVELRKKTSLVLNNQEVSNMCCMLAAYMHYEHSSYHISNPVS